ncbi:MAG TPA: hypothetical protein VKL21_10440 [Candidatus Methanoperedens sp.]|nr:hypothetical protein [Candidatus Methanoperedens sp.]
MLNPASGGASAGVWGRTPAPLKIMLTESVNRTRLSAVSFLKYHPDKKIISGKNIITK